MIKITNFWLQKVKAKLYEIRRCAPLFTQYKINTKTICNPQYKIHGKTIGNSQRKKTISNSHIKQHKKMHND